MTVQNSGFEDRVHMPEVLLLWYWQMEFRSMDDIDVDEIETFSVLKDAAATAVYGSKVLCN